jgi:hypothetical protein
MLLGLGLMPSAAHTSTKGSRKAPISTVVVERRCGFGRPTEEAAIG